MELPILPTACLLAIESAYSVGTASELLILPTTYSLTSIKLSNSSSSFVSSPEQEVLMVSYCGQSMPAVRRVRRAVSKVALKA